MREDRNVFRVSSGVNDEEASWGCRRRGCCSVLGDDKIVSASGVARALPEVSRFFDFPMQRIYTSYSSFYSFLFSFFFCYDSFSKRNRRFKDRYKDIYSSFLLNYHKHSAVNIKIFALIFPYNVIFFFHFITNMKMHKIYYSSTRFFFGYAWSFQR